MNLLQNILQNISKPLLSVYFTAGFPELNSTSVILHALEKSGVDMVEIGLPFSDPLADGVVIQQSSQKALANGMNLQKYLQQLAEIRPLSKLPFILMGYYNPVYQFGMENLLRECSKIGIDALIIPDLPPQEYEEKYKSLFEQYNISFVFLITPQTPTERMHKIDHLSSTFIYAVSSAATTGNALEIDEKKLAYFERIKSVGLKHPIIIGFGINGKQNFDLATKYAAGAIIGSAYIKIISQSTNIEQDTENFIRGIRN
jgi:tryptophan synthase alpha chain